MIKLLIVGLLLSPLVHALEPSEGFILIGESATGDAQSIGLIDDTLYTEGLTTDGVRTLIEIKSFDCRKRTITYGAGHVWEHSVFVGTDPNWGVRKPVPTTMEYNLLTTLCSTKSKKVM